MGRFFELRSRTFSEVWRSRKSSFNSKGGSVKLAPFASSFSTDEAEVVVSKSFNCCSALRNWNEFPAVQFGKVGAESAFLVNSGMSSGFSGFAELGLVEGSSDEQRCLRNYK